MRFRFGAGRAVLVPALGLVLAASITACSSSSTPSSSSSTPASSPTAAASSTASGSTGASGNTTATIKANWEKFFAGSTPTSERIALLQNGQKFAPALSGLSAMGSSASVKVASVTLKSPTAASVKYSIYLGSNPALPNVTGTAVNSNGTWQVSDSSLCQLLTMQNGGKAPSVCSSAS